MDGNGLTWVFLAVYAAIIAFIAYKGYQVSKSDGDMLTYTLARGYLGPVTLGLAWAATFASAVTFLGNPGLVYSGGLSAIPVMTIGWWGSAMLGVIIVARKFRKMGRDAGSLSVPEWIGDRYNSQYVTMFFALLVLLNVFYIAAQFTGITLLFNELLGLSYEVGVLGSLAAVVLYIMVGGTYSDVMTDFVQSLVMIVIGFAVFAVIFTEFGGLLKLADTLAAESPVRGQLFNDGFLFGSPWAYVGTMFAAFLTGVLPQLGNKFLSLRSERDVKLFIYSATFGLFAFNLVLFAGPMAFLQNPDLAAADRAILVVITDFFPPAITALFGVALLSATISTTDGLLVSCGTAIGNDFYRNLATDDDSDNVPQSIERRSVLITRVMVAAVGISAAGIALTQPQYLSLLAAVGIFGFLVGAAPPIFLGLFWNGATAPAAIASGIVGPVIFLGRLQGWWLDWIMIYPAASVSAILSGLVFVVVSLVTSAPSKPAAQPTPSDD
jgi:Na+/proline symporter